MKQCIYTKTLFESSTGEHILQNFLGTRWTSNEIASNEVQDKFGKTIDVALEQGLQPIRNLLGTKGGRGGSGPTLKRIETTGGQKVNLSPGGQPEIAEPFIKTKQVDGNLHEVQITLGNEKQLGWAIAKLKSEFPTAKFDIEELRGKMNPRQGYLDGQVHLKMGFGGDDFFRGILKSAFNLLGVQNSTAVLSDEFDPVRDYILNCNGENSDFIRWAADIDPLKIPALGEFDHFLCVYSEGNSVFGAIQLFGEISYFLCLSSNYSGAEFKYSYLVDSLREADPAEVRNVDFDPALLPKFFVQHKMPGSDVWPVYSEKMSRLMSKWYKKADRDMLSKIVDEVLLPHDGEMFTRELKGELIQKVTDYFARRITKGTQQKDALDKK